MQCMIAARTNANKRTQQYEKGKQQICTKHLEPRACKRSTCTSDPDKHRAVRKTLISLEIFLSPP